MNRFDELSKGAAGVLGGTVMADSNRAYSRRYPQETEVAEKLAAESAYQAMKNSACAVMPQSMSQEIPMALGDLDSSLNLLFELVNRLVAKLSPVLRNEPSVASDRKERSYSTDLGGRLGSLRRSIDCVHDTLQDVSGKLEL